MKLLTYHLCVKSSPDTPERNHQGTDKGVRGSTAKNSKLTLELKLDGKGHLELQLGQHSLVLHFLLLNCLPLVIMPQALFILGIQS